MKTVKKGKHYFLVSDAYEDMPLMSRVLVHATPSSDPEEADEMYYGDDNELSYVVIESDDYDSGCWAAAGYVKTSDLFSAEEILQRMREGVQTS